MKRESSIDPLDALLQSDAYCFSLRRTVIIPDESRIAPVSATPADIGLGPPISCCRIEARKSHNEVVAVCPSPHPTILHSDGHHREARGAIYAFPSQPFFDLKSRRYSSIRNCASCSEMSPLFRAEAIDFPQIRCSISFLFTSSSNCKSAIYNMTVRSNQLQPSHTTHVFTTNLAMVVAADNH